VQLRSAHVLPDVVVARPKGFEPLTGGLEIHCSIQLSYGRVWGTEWLSRTGSSSWMGKPHAAALVAL
jgi:hypothetical protein